MCQVAFDGSVLFGVLKDPSPSRRLTIVRDACIGLPRFSALVYVAVGEPVRLILLGAFGQALMLPFLGLTALYLRHRASVPGGGVPAAVVDHVDGVDGPLRIAP